ncbi:amino acid racemase [Merdimmobilis hominis]|uniref:aspartate/glutamate racemase family protein n=1 Tax=Merdimmobilis hominis TaxID=2897707 RepID=UPI002804057F|nr:amino acid racemase [uncultured Merdimmobilis sp.]
MDLFRRIVEETHASKEEEHIHILVDCNPKMPSRQEAILCGGPSPVPAMVETARNLQQAGADCIILGANTAHYFLDEVSAQVDIPFLDILEEAVKELLRQVPQAKRVGVLATFAAMESGLYQSYCARRGIEVIPLDPLFSKPCKLPSSTSNTTASCQRTASPWRTLPTVWWNKAQKLSFWAAPKFPSSCQG